MRRSARRLFAICSAVVTHITRLRRAASAWRRTSWPFSPMPRLKERVGRELAVHLCDQAERRSSGKWTRVFQMSVGAVAGIVSIALTWSLPAGRPGLRIACLLALGVLALAVAASREQRNVRRSLAAVLLECGHCPACGYDLRATPARCPECGPEHAG
jgi:hypothetical protein